MKFLKLSGILLIIASLFGCKQGLPEFPANYIYVAYPDKQECTKHEIIKKDPITVDNGVYIPWSDCPHVFGFSQDDIAPIMDWMRNAQEEAKKRCK
ncbi:MAG: hypothetical protein K2Q18_06080 [Bdellovibrionales bacterium]|nr:hypothetical protein [Bdellovibrionales bacterium]